MAYYTKLEDALSAHGWKVIDDKQPITEIYKYFDPLKINHKSGSPMITTTRKTVMVCDNYDWNETYLIDLVNTYLDETILGEQYDLVYCNNPVSRNFIQNRSKVIYGLPNDTNSRLYSELVSDFERAYLATTLIVINPRMDVIVTINDKKETIEQTQVDYLMEYLIDSICDKRLV